jgi:FkbM family methyltransferase
MISRDKLKKIPRLFLAIISLTKKRTWGPFLETWENTRFDQAFSVSWSQGGEDLALLQLLPKNPGKYIDVGAHHPSRFSVTRHQKDWRGINIDANPDSIAEFIRHRPEDISLNFCVGTQVKYVFHIFDEPAISTSNTEWKERFIVENHSVKASLEIQGVTLFSIINKYFDSRPDLLIVDAEGSDFDVLESCRWSELHRDLWPLWIVCETSPPAIAAQSSAQVKLLLTLGYQIQCILPMSTILRLDGTNPG